MEILIIIPARDVSCTCTYMRDLPEEGRVETVEGENEGKKGLIFICMIAININTKRTFRLSFLTISLGAACVRKM